MKTLSLTPQRAQTKATEKASTSPFGLFQKIFIFYWLFSLLGHYAEVIWAYVNHAITGQPLDYHIVSTVIPLAMPYGLGAIAVILLVWPLIKAHKINPVATLILNIIITSAVEYACAIILIIFTGHNYYWSYLDKPFNISGYVCLESGIVFGTAATIFIYFIYPFFEKIIQRFSRQQLNIIFWILLTTNITDLLYTSLK